VPIEEDEEETTTLIAKRETFQWKLL
jgi:hypothetical protein